MAEQDGMIDCDSEFEIFEVIQRIQKLNKEQVKKKDQIADIKNEIQGKREQLARINENTLTLKKTARTAKDKVTKLQVQYKLDKNNKPIVNKEYLMQKQKEHMKKEKEEKAKKKLNFFRFFDQKDEDEDEENQIVDMDEIQKDELIVDKEEEEREKAKKLETEFRIIQTLNNIIDGKSNDVRTMENDKYQQTVLVSDHKLDDILTSINSKNSLEVRFNTSKKNNSIQVIYDKLATFNDVLQIGLNYWKLPGDQADYAVIDEYNCEILLETSVNDFIWQRSAMEFSQKIVQIDLKNIKQLEPHPMQAEASKQAEDEKKENTRESKQPIIENSIIHIYRNKLLASYEFITYFFEEFRGLKRYISKKSLENLEALKLKGSIGFEFDDFSGLALFLVVCLFAMVLSSIIIQNDYLLVQTFNNNYKERLNSFTYVSLQGKSKYMKLSEVINRFQVLQYLSKGIGPTIFKSATGNSGNLKDDLTTLVADRNILVGKLILRQVMQKTYDCAQYQTDAADASRFMKKSDTKKNLCRNPKYSDNEKFTDDLGDKTQPWTKYQTAEQTKISSTLIDDSAHEIGGDGYLYSFDKTDSMEKFQSVLMAMEKINKVDDEPAQPITYTNLDGNEGVISVAENQHLYDNWLNYNTYRLVLQCNVFNPQLNQFLNIVLISAVTPLGRVTQDPPQLRNFKTTIYQEENKSFSSDGTEYALYTAVKTLDTFSIVFSLFLFIYMFIQTVYKENSINTEYLSSPESFLNLLIITFTVNAVVNARYISDTDTSYQTVLKDNTIYTTGYYDFSSKIKQYSDYRSSQAVALLLLIQKMSAFLKLERRLYTVIYIINLCGSNMMLYYLVVMPIYFGISQSISNLQGPQRQKYSTTYSSFVNTLFLNLSAADPHEFLMYEPTTNLILMYLILLINQVLFKGVILGTQMETYRQQIRQLGYDFKSRDKWNFKDLCYYLFAWLPKTGLNKFMKPPRDIKETQQYLAREKYMKKQRDENKKLKMA